MHVCIIGAGVAGLGLAHALLAADCKVTLIDSSGTVASGGASRMNGAQVDVKGVNHLQALMTSQTRVSFQSLVSLSFHPRWILEHLKFRAQPWTHDSKTKSLRLLAQQNLHFIQTLAPNVLKQGEYWKITSNDKHLPPTLEGHIQKRPTPVWVGSSWEFCKQVALQLSLSSQLDWKPNTTMNHFITQHSKVTGIRVTTNGTISDIQADIFVLCTGAHIGQHTPVPILPVAGTVVEINTPIIQNNPKVVMYNGHQLFWANLGSKIRFGRGVEILKSPDDPRKVSLGCEHPSYQRTRAVSPDGLPVIGHVTGRPNNVYMVGGLGFFGWTVGFAAGHLLGEHLVHNTPIPENLNSKRFRLF